MSGPSFTPSTLGSRPWVDDRESLVNSNPTLVKGTKAPANQNASFTSLQQRDVPVVHSMQDEKAQARAVYPAQQLKSLPCMCSTGHYPHPLLHANVCTNFLYVFRLAIISCVGILNTCLFASMCASYQC